MVIDDDGNKGKDSNDDDDDDGDDCGMNQWQKNIGEIKSEEFSIISLAA